MSYQPPHPPNPGHYPPPHGGPPPQRPAQKSGVTLTPKMLAIGGAALALVALLVGIVIGTSGDSDQPTAASDPASGTSSGDITGSRDDWLAAVCEPGRFKNGGTAFPNATAGAFCSASAKSGNPNAALWIVEYDSNYMLMNDMKALHMTQYASAIDDAGSIIAFVNNGNQSGVLEPLLQFGFTINQVQ